ncbi:MAG: hypothetical protein JXP34_20180 [Planctomycetes bacterium]|nr:hypothetical protein [Planctomycetota bacterium]
MKLDWDTLFEAFEQESETVTSYLDRATGRILQVNELDPEASDLDAEEAASLPERYLRIVPANADEEKAWAREFLDGLGDEALRASLRESLDQPDGIVAFGNALGPTPSVRQEWFTFREDRIFARIDTWLRNAGISPANAPPWQE